MQEPERCSRCRREAVARQPYSGRALCAAHLVRDVESRAKRAIRQQGGLRHEDRVGVLAPGGPYGEALLTLVARLFAARRDLTLVALRPGEGPPSAGPAGDGSSSPAALRLGCSLLLVPTILEERAADVLGAVLTGRQGSLAGATGGRPRVVRPFENVPGLEIRLYLGAVTGTPAPPAPAATGGAFEALVADELARHTARHPSAPFALVRLAETIAELASGEPDRC